MNNNLWVNLWEVAVLHGGLMIRPCQEQGSLTNAFFSNLKTVNMKIFLQEKIFLLTWKHIHLKINSWPVYRIKEGFILEEIIRRFERLCHDHPDFDILFGKLAGQIGVWIWKTIFPHYASRVGDFMQSQTSFLISLVVTCILMSWIWSPFRFV